MPPSELITRPAREKDFEFLFELHRSTLRDYIIRIYGIWNEDWQCNNYRRYFWPEITTILQYDGKDIGMVKTFRERECLYLSEFEIAPSYQNRGFGSGILITLQQECNRTNRAFELQVFKNNPASRLYARHGFFIIGENITHQQMRLEPGAILTPTALS